MNSDQAVTLLGQSSREAIARVNDFTCKVMRTRGGRIGAGMGTVLETLYGYFLNQVLAEQGSDGELAWLANNEYNDFAFVECATTWDPAIGSGELLRLEVKAMVRDADESKAHFDEIQKSIGEHDLLLVLGWAWHAVDDVHVSPRVTDWFLGSALAVAALRDRLHIARGGTFVASGSCPDGCSPDCSHVGEPLNASGNRERLSGPLSTKPANCSYAANFGGLVRMLKAQRASAREELWRARTEDEVAHRYICFVDSFIPEEEVNRLTTAEWREVAVSIGVDATGSSTEILQRMRSQVPGYQDRLRDYFTDRFRG